MVSVPPALWPSLKIVQVYGANTGVGKTIVSTAIAQALCNRFQLHGSSPASSSSSPTLVRYLKPVSTGPNFDADHRHLHRYVPQASTKCLFNFSSPLSPHLAAQEDGNVLTDTTILESLQTELQEYANSASQAPQYVLIETAGGPLSPSPSGTPQADLYRPFRFPSLIVADSELGGISSTISAYESLTVRGYDVVGMFVFDNDRWKNLSYLSDYFSQRRTANPMTDAVLMPIPIFPVMMPPGRDEEKSRHGSPVDEQDQKRMSVYYEKISRTRPIQAAISLISDTHEGRIKDLKNLATRAHKAIWYPFMQHQGTTAQDIKTFDSAYGDYFHAFTSDEESRAETPLLRPTFDASASWWTQGLGHGNPKLALTAAHAAGQYGHVMFAGAAHEPAIGLIEDLLNGMAQDHSSRRLTRGFYSDDGSTATEVAVKMAVRAFEVRASKCNAWENFKTKRLDTLILGLRGSYHGDTLGAMDCAEPSIYSEGVSWHRGRGFWFEFPTVNMKKEKWVVEWPKGMANRILELGGRLNMEYRSLEEVFDLQTRSREMGAENVYEKLIQAILEDQVFKMRAKGKRFGVLILEPIVLGAGGMLFVDPLFQATLVRTVRKNGNLFGTSPQKDEDTNPMSSQTPHDWTGLPVIYDEVFTGIYRLGRFSSSSFLQQSDSGANETPITPDISAHAKLLTGGILPLSVTLASESIFEAFLGSDTKDALLHGHSYTAHPIGCSVARESLRLMRTLHKPYELGSTVKSPNLQEGNMGSDSGSEATLDDGMSLGIRLATRSGSWSVWSDKFVKSLSNRPDIEGVFALGTVLSLTIRPKDGNSGGYTSSACAHIRKHLLTSGDRSNQRTANMYVRVLGNVLYVLASHSTLAKDINKIEATVVESLDATLK